MEYYGKVLWFDERDGYGIAETDDGTEFYIDVSVIEGRENLQRNQRIEWQYNPNVKDCRCGWKVRKV